MRVGKTGAHASAYDRRTLSFKHVRRAAEVAGSTQPFRAPAAHFDYRSAPYVGDRWPILGNDRYGCCTFAGIVRIGLLRAAKRGIDLGITDDDVVRAYLDCTGGEDVGETPINALNYMRNVGIKGYKVLAYARVDDHDLDERRSALQTFGALYVAAGLPSKLDDDRDNVLELTPEAQRTDRDKPRSLGGHAYNVFGGQRDEEMVVLWTDDVTEQQDFTDYYREENWVFTDNVSVDDDLLALMLDQLAALRAA